MNETKFAAWVGTLILIVIGSVLPTPEMTPVSRLSIAALILVIAWAHARAEEKS